MLGRELVVELSLVALQKFTLSIKAIRQKEFTLSDARENKNCTTG